MSIRNKTIVAVVLIALSAIVPIVVFSYSRARAALVDSTERHLTSVVGKQRSALRELLANYHDKARLVASRTRLRQLVAEHATGGSSDGRASMERILDDAARSDESIRGLWVYDSDGVLLASTGTGEPVGLDSISLVGSAEAPRIELPAAMKLEGATIGSLTVHLSPTKLFALVADATGLGETGETLLARKAKDGSAVFLTPTRRDASAMLQTTVPGDRLDVPMTHALLGRESFFEPESTVDYADRPVFAATAYVPEVGWGLVAKLDEAEVFAPFGESVRSLSMFALVLLASVIGVGAIIASRFTSRIERLRDGVAEVRGGRLDAHVEVTRGDELGELADGFNAMVARLREARARQDAHAKELERANKEVEQFASIASHDLRAPLRHMRQLATWIVDDLGDDVPGDVKDHSEKIVERADRLERLIEGLLEYSRAGRDGTEPEVVDTVNLVMGIVEDLGLDETFDVTVGDLPTLETSKTPLETVLRNLVSNARKHHDREDGHIEVMAEEDPDKVRFRVADDGPGIPKEYQESVFEVFRTLNAGSTGLGLALVKRLVESNGGEITVTSEDGERGTAFEFTWPRHRA